MLYVIAGLGFAAERLGWFPESTARLCTKLLLYIVMPCVVVNSFVSMEHSPQAVRGLGISLACGALLHLTGIAVTEPFYRGRKNAAAECVLHYTAVYGNCGYMGLPLAQAMVGQQGVFYVSAVMLTFQLCCFTHGDFVMGGGQLFRRQGSGDRGQVTRFKWKSLVFNAGVVGVALGLPIFLLQIPLPELIKTPMASVAAMNTPLAMLIFGTYLSRARLSGILRSKKIFLTGAVKLFIVPAAVLAAMLFLLRTRPDPALLGAVMIPAAAPPATNTVVFAAKHERDTSYAAQVVSLLSLVSVVTMPLMIALGMSL